MKKIKFILYYFGNTIKFYYWPLLFNIFLFDLLSIIEDFDIANYADDQHTIVEIPWIKLLNL